MGSILRGVVRSLVFASNTFGRLMVLRYAIDGFGEVLQYAWCVVFRARPLTPEEIAASREVHPEGLIPYSKIRVNEGSVITRVNGRRAVSTMHVLHYPKGGLPLATVVHELSHTAQFERAGGIIMAQALHAQLWGGGYNYGDLMKARQAGKRFADFNREQQAQICEDYYRATHGLPTWFGGTAESLRPFIDEMRQGQF